MGKHQLGPEWSEYLNLIKSRPEEFQPDPRFEIVFDEDIVAEYVRTHDRKIGVLYQSPYRMMIVDLLHINGEYVAYERLMTFRSGGVVGIVKCDGKFVLLRQYRHAMQGEQYAFPRGFSEPGILDEENIKKEIREEINALVISTKRLGTVIADSGLSGNEVSVFFCEVDAASYHDCYEGITDLIFLEEDELRTWIREGKITDGFSLAAYALYQSGTKAD